MNILQNEGQLELVIIYSIKPMLDVDIDLR